MLSIQDAIGIIQQNLPGGVIEKFIQYRGLYVFQVFGSSATDDDFDPYFSVNMATREFRDFSILTDGDIAELTPLFMTANKIIYNDYRSQ